MIEINKNADAFQKIKVAFLRKSDRKLINVKLTEIFRQIKTADFTNNEITLKGNVCILNSFQPKYDPKVLSISKAEGTGAGNYSVEGVVYEQDTEFAVNNGNTVDIAVVPDEGSELESIKDAEGKEYQVVNNALSVKVEAALSLVITFKVVEQPA